MKHRPLFSSPVPRHVRNPKIHWQAWPIVWVALKRTCFVIGALVLFSFVIGFISVMQASEPPVPSMPRQAVLYLSFEDDFAEMHSNRFGGFSNEPPTVHEVIDAIDQATEDKRVKGIVARMDGGTYTPSHVEEIREALKRFKAAGKFTKIYSPSYGESVGGLGRFYLASVFDERWMQPLGIVSIPGISAEMPFFRGALDEIGVQPQFFKRKEYKTAYENLTDKEMSKENREEIGAVVSDLRGKMVMDISADLKINAKHFEELVDKGLFTAEEALKEKLITTSGYADVMIEQVSEQLTGDPDTDEEIYIDPQYYMAAVQREQSERNFVTDLVKGRPRVALVYAVGAIMDTNVGGGESIAAADEIAPAILEASDDPSIEAIVVRIDSPGGSPGASESILRAIQKAKEKEKLIIVSMGPTAASGGYWIAAYADRIFVMPTTLTGSIGVVGGKFSAEKAWEKLHVAWDGVNWGTNSGIWSLNKPFSDTEAERINAMLDQVYKAFLERVSKGRDMSIEDVDKIARGRVWTGQRAVKIGLADEIGGLREALNYTATALGAKDKNGIDIITLPEPKSAFEELIALLEEQGMVYEGLKFQGMIGSTVGPLMNQASVLSRMGPVSTYELMKVE